MRVPKSLTQKIPWMVSLLFIVLFVYAAVSKLLDFETFETQLAQSPLLSAYAKPVAIGVPLLEFLISFLLMFKRFRRIALFGFFTLMVMFTTYIVIILNFTDFVPCSCGGVLEAMGWTEHLIFNSVFILLSALSLWLISSEKRKILLTLCLLTIFSIGAVTIVFLSSEKQIKRNNAFLRRYMPHPIEEIGQYDLEYDSYYIAGMDEQTIYLGNVTAPLLIKEMSLSLDCDTETIVTIDSMHLPYQRVRIVVEPPYFYVGDGTVPILFRGDIRSWRGKVYSYDEAYFSEFVVADSTYVGLKTISSETKTSVLALLDTSTDSTVVSVKTDILSKQVDGVFDSDGVLLWNDKYRQYVYVYYYRNSYEVADDHMAYQFSGTTIDTVRSAILDIAHYTTTDQFKLGKKVMINRRANSWGNYLYIHSDRLGQYEDEEGLRSASIMDVYDITDDSYAFSFYLYHQRGEKLSDFKVYKDILIAMVNDRLWIYRLKPEYFSAGF